MEAPAVTAAQGRWAFLLAGVYCVADLAFHYYGLIESVSKSLHIPAYPLFFGVEVAFVLLGVGVAKRLWRMRQTPTVWRLKPSSALLIVTLLFVAFNTLFIMSGLLIKFSGHS
jgi:hypothetical protein